VTVSDFHVETPVVRVKQGASFDALRDRGGLEAGEAYLVYEPSWNPNGPALFGFSPDGVGMLWYDTYEELEAAHGASV
jgi:hypothetical protein